MRLQLIAALGLRRLVQHSLVMIVHSYRQRLLGLVLPNAILVEVVLNLDGFWDGTDEGRLLGFNRRQLFIENAFAKNDAVIADVDPWTLNELLYFCMRFSAEAAQGNICWPRH